jgi:arylsulfatase A
MEAVWVILGAGRLAVNWSKLCIARETDMSRTLFVLMVAGVVGKWTIAAAAPPERPNLVLIMADDLGIEGLGCYGGTDYATPHLDRLAENGLRFTHAYAQPLCTPTRVQIMTGKYNQRNWQAFGLLPRGEKTFGHLMSGLGYKTCLAGKWQLTSYDPPDFPGAEKRRGIGTHPRDAGFDEYSLFHAEETEDKGSRYANPTFLRNGVLHKDVDGAYGEDLTVDYILDFLKRHRDDPTFVYYPMALPHWPMVPTPHSSVWSDPSRRLEEDTKYFKDMVEYMDVLVGRLVRGIEQLGLRERTLVLFYSDNGTDKRIVSRMGGQTVPGGKGEVTQNGIRVPLIAYWPGVIEPGLCGDLVDATDFLPTLIEMAGGRVPDDWGAEGVSFAPQLLGREGKPRDWVYFWYDPRPGWDKEKYRRHVFALDRQYKLFSDGRLFDIAGEGFREIPIDAQTLSAEATAARNKLQAVIEAMEQPPLSQAARQEVDAFGRPVRDE